MRGNGHPAISQSWTDFIALLAIAFVLGVTIIIPIGGADMPVVVSMLNNPAGPRPASASR